MRRIIGWLALAVALIGLGVLIHVGTPPSPRWTARAGRRDVTVAARLVGDRFVTMPYGHGGPNGPLEVRDVRTGEPLSSAWPDGAETFAFRFSADGRRGAGVVGAGAARSLRWVDLSTGQQQEIGLGGGNWSFAHFSPDGRLILVDEAAHPPAGGVAPTECGIQAIDLESGRRLVTLKRSASGYWAFAAGRLAFNREGPEGLQLWDLATGRIDALPTECLNFEVSPDGRRAFAETAGGLDLWGLDGPPRRIASFSGRSFRRAIFSADGRSAAAATGDAAGPCTVRHLDPATGGVRWECSFLAPLPELDLVLSADRRYLAVLIGHGLEVLDLEGRRRAWSRAGLKRVAFAPDSVELLAFDAAGEAVHALDAATGSERLAVRMPRGRLPEPLFAAVGRQLWLHELGHDGPPATWLGRVLGWLRPPGPDDQDGVLLGVGWPSGRELLRLTDRVGPDFHVADDGSFVITLHDRGGHQLIQRWDLSQPRPWAWSVGVPSALGASLLALRWWWLSRPRRAESVS